MTQTKEERAAYNKVYHAAHYAANKEAIRERNLAYRERRLVAGARHRAKKGGYPCTLTVEDVIIPERCPMPLCGNQELFIGTGNRGPSKYSPTLDKIAPELGYVPGNVMVVCYQCNLRKGAMSPDDMRTLLSFYEKKGYVNEGYNATTTAWCL